jgi:hypothetical protein
LREIGVAKRGETFHFGVKRTRFPTYSGPLPDQNFNIESWKWRGFFDGRIGIMEMAEGFWVRTAGSVEMAECFEGFFTAESAESSRNTRNGIEQ